MFKDFGIVSFVPSSKVNDFVKYLKEGKLAGTRCRKCGAYYMPPRADCVQCYSSEVEWVEKSNIGTLITFTTIYSAPTGFEERVPYNLGIA